MPRRRAASAALAQLFDAAIAALEPRRLVRAALRGDALAGLRARIRRDGALLIGAGKGAARLAAALEAELTPALVEGIVIVPPGYEYPLRRVQVRAASHPLPDRRTVDATRALLAALDGNPTRPVLAVITGGASSLLELPAPGLTLADVRRTHAVLLASGAPIAAMNTVRTHISAVKGGRLAARLAGRASAALVLSDVAGDDLAVVGSGPTVPDPSTWRDVRRVVRAYDLAARLPPRVIAYLDRGLRRRVAETPKPGRRRHAVPTVLLGGNRTACAGAARHARRQGFEPVVHARAPLTGVTADAARVIAARVHAARARVREGAVALLVAGGETTVRVPRDAGRGGRNQELALAVARLLAGEPGWMLLCAGTDGIDGPTDAAGAFVDGGTVARAQRAGWSVNTALARHDVYPLLAAIGALHRPGPTGTNVADLMLALVWRHRGWRLPRSL
jgi:hydroxypyruvate reductase